MSTTFTLPVSANDAFQHGHHHHHQSSSFHLKHSRQNTGGRSLPLSSSIALPRSPERFMQTSRNHPRSPLAFGYSMEEEFKRIKPQNGSPLRPGSLAPTPRLEPDGYFPSIEKQRSPKIGPDVAKAYKSIPRHVSRPTKLLLQTTENYSLLHGILADTESRRIFYFMLLNLAFMVIQSTYGFLTGSLGLISDSIHMFFDCVALLVGVCAAVMSKWPPSVKFPYGYGKVDTLAGLGNGIFLMLISVEIVYEAVERLFSGAEISRTNELLIVSLAGFAVNCVGILAFHGHHGHDHGHGHGHSHDHAHEESHSHNHSRKTSDENDHSHDHAHDHVHHRHSHTMTQNTGLLIDGITTAPTAGTPKRRSAAGGHSHGSENMQGIYLHIMADALGSVSVVVSTLLVKMTGWTGWDPIASCLIAVLIFISTIPLVTSTTRILLLSLDSDVEYNIRDVLGAVSDIKGVMGYTVPKFWLEDIKKEVGHGHHHHGPSEDQSHHHHKHKDSCDSKTSDCVSDDSTVLGVIHVVVSQHADREEVKTRVQRYLESRKMDVVVQAEHEGEGRCWCGGLAKTP